MDTQTAINNIQAGIDQLNTQNTEHSDSIAKNNVQIQAYTVAIQQLKGLLDTPSADLVLATTRAETAEATVATLTTEKADLQTQLDEATGKVSLSDPVNTVDPLTTP